MVQQILIKLEDNVINCSFDRCGNLYFSLLNEPEKIYDISVNKDNSLSLDIYSPLEENDDVDIEVGVDVDTEELAIGELRPVKGGNTLKGKVIEDIEKDDERDSESEDDNRLIEDVEREYFSENRDYIEYIYEGKNRNKVYFSFNLVSNEDSEKIIFDREKIHALYDTIVYDGSPSENNLIMKTTLVNDLALYRLCLYTSGEISFRAIGSANSWYRVKFSDNSLQLVKAINH